MLYFHWRNKGGRPMKEVLHRKRCDVDKGMKLITISSRASDQEGQTRVRKSFLYNVWRAQTMDMPVHPPQIYIHKSFDTKRHLERFSFQVKGSFYTTDKTVLVRVYFHHSLHVQILWKEPFLPHGKASG